MAVKVSLGIIAYNEEANIGVLLDTVLKDAPRPEVLTEIFVVASGCTDCTEDIVRGFVKKDSRIKLIVQSERKGKASAINLFFSATTGDILILESADTVPAQGTLSRIMAAFDDPEVGMAGGHPVPVNPENTFIGFTVHLMWSLHHQIALERPKLGELVAFQGFF